MNNVSITKYYQFLAENLPSFIEEKAKKEMDNRSVILATKDDITNLKADIANFKADIIKWMFIFWIGQLAATFGFILLFLKK